MGLDSLACVPSVAKAQLLDTGEGGSIVLGSRVHGRSRGKVGVEICKLLSKGKKLGSVTHRGARHGSRGWNRIAIMAWP